MRVGATTGLGARYLARQDARSAAILGCGWQAGAQALAAVTVRPLEKLYVYSPDESHRRAFAQQLHQELDIAVEAMSSAEQAVRLADMVLCATNSLQPVLSRDWLRPGVHVGSIREGELAAEEFSVYDRIVVHDPGNITNDHLVVASGIDHREKSSPLMRVLDNAPSLADLVAGQTPARQKPEEITAFLNYHGLGYQFAAAGAVLLEKALAAGRGVELPDEWFTQDVHS
jgi:ornithine cyclodeaminase/alanine dehydrogenase-like protein (mu-crystallin family)